MPSPAVPQRLSLVTLGVNDVVQSRAFFEGLGWVAGEANAEVAFFDMNGVILALFGRGALAEDAGVAATGAGFSGVALAINVASPEEVSRILAVVENCGGQIVKVAQPTFWGGFAGYFADPDGHLWEVAHNPFWPLDDAGRPQLPKAPAP